MNLLKSFAFSSVGSSILRLCLLVLAPFFLSPLSAAEPLPLPDVVLFKSDAKLPLGIKDTTLACAIVSEDPNVLVVETSSVPGVTARFSLDKTLIDKISRGDPSLRPFAEISPDLALPPESREAVFYDDVIDRVFRPYLKKFPASPQAPKVKEAEKAYTDELQRVTQGEFRVGQRWTQKSFLTPLDLKAITLIQQARKEGVSMSLANFKKLIEEARTCFSSELFPDLGETLDQVSDQRVALLKKAAAEPGAPPKPTFEEQKTEEIAALLPISGWNWDNLNKAVDMVSRAETMLKNNPAEQVSKPIELIKQSQSLMPFLIARERILRQQAAAYGEKGVAEAKAEKRESSLAWWTASLELAALLPPPENQTLKNDILTLFEKTFTARAASAAERREFGEAKVWLTDVQALFLQNSIESGRLGVIKTLLSDNEALLRQQTTQQTIDNLRKTLAEFQVQNNFESTRTILTGRWEEISKLNPTDEEKTAFAQAALDQALTAIKSFHFTTGYQLLKIAREISPEDPRVKNWILTISLSALAIFLVLLFPIFWILAKGGAIFENLRYRWRLKGLKKKTPKKMNEPGRRR